MTHREYLSAVKQNSVWFTEAPKVFMIWQPFCLQRFSSNENLKTSALLLDLFRDFVFYASSMDKEH